MTEQTNGRLSSAPVDFWQDESGATAVEYGLLVALLGLAIATTLTSVGNPVRAAFELVFNALDAI